MDNHCRWCIIHHCNDVINASNFTCIKTDELVDGWSATDFKGENMKGFDEWATDPENKGVYPRGEQKEEIDLRFVKEEDEEIKSLISSEPFN